MPARAPRPGAVKRLEIDEQMRAELDSGFEIHCATENRTVKILFGDLDSADELACLNETGFTPQDLMSKTMTHTAILVFYWLGLRKLSDPRPFSKIVERFGTPRKFLEAGFDAWGLGLFADDEEREDSDTVDPSEPDEPSEPPGPPTPGSSESTPGTTEGPPS